MSDLISKERLIEEFMDAWIEYSMGDKRLQLSDTEIIETVRHQPTIEAEPVRHGKWRFDAENDVWCTSCKTKCLRDDIGVSILSPYCPNCGAKMDGEENE